MDGLTITIGIIGLIVVVGIIVLVKARSKKKNDRPDDDIYPVF